MIAKLTGAAFTVALATAQTAPSDANQRPAPQSSGRCSVPLLSFRVPDNHGYKLNVIPVPPAFKRATRG
ncbi:MAG TPA: hypothetical protein VES20_25340 [Bryobacteraceae bacterium]|nr:hypothetical protein [Bryobacteraceae bacterium]